MVTVRRIQHDRGKTKLQGYAGSGSVLLGLAVFMLFYVRRVCLLIDLGFN